MEQTTGHLRLNLGCGLKAHPNWINVDGSWNARLARRPLLRKTLASLGLLQAEKAQIPWGRDIFIHDIRKPLPFPNDSADVVYASHVLEHLYREEGQQLARESFRVLHPGGIIRIVVPDINTIVREYQGERPYGELAAREKNLPPADLLNERLLMRWPSPSKRNLIYRVYEALEDFHSHKWMYDVQSLSSLLSSVGFVDIESKTYGESAIPHIAEIEDASRILNGGGICVEARKS
jgi:SAM-dependent methyltransferase